MKMTKKNGCKKPTTFEEHGKGCIVLVESRDPRTKITILKNSYKKHKKSKSKPKQSEGMGLFGW